MTPKEALDRAITLALSYTSRKAPGAVIERLNKTDRKALEKLTSDDAANVRLYR